MAKDSKFWIMLVITLLCGWDALIRNINNFVEGFKSWWGGLAPIIQLALVIITLYLIFKKK